MRPRGPQGDGAALGLAAALALLPALLPPALAASPPSGLGAEVEAMTGARTRIVWLRGVNRTGGFNPFWDEFRYAVMAFDTREGVEREIARPAKTAWPRIAPDGSKVLFSTSKSLLKDESRVFIVDWDGRNLKEFAAPGYVYDVWRDPATGFQWAYIGDTFCAKGLRRHRIDDPSVVEAIFGPDKGLAVQEMMVSGDGKCAIGLWPHPRVSLLDLATGTLGPRLAEGCNLSIAPDSSHRWWMMDGRHRFVSIRGPDGRELASVNVFQGGEGMNGREVWNPGWTNRTRIFTINGPYEKLHLAGSDIYVGKLNEPLTQVEKFVRITDNDEAETNQHGWVGELAEAPRIAREPEGRSADEGETATFTVSAEGEPAPAYQWHVNGAAVRGATGASFDLKASRETKGARVHCVVTNSEGRATSRTVALEVKLKGPSPEETAKWDARLLANMRGALKAGKRPALNPKSKRDRRDVVSIGANDALGVEMTAGMQVGVPWAKLTADEKAALALSILRQKPDDHCLVAFYLLAAGRAPEAEAHLKNAGDEAKAVRAMFR